ncbi:unnamed protein product [Victoria cruziana]
MEHGGMWGEENMSPVGVGIHFRVFGFPVVTRTGLDVQKSDGQPQRKLVYAIVRIPRPVDNKLKEQIRHAQFDNKLKEARIYSSTEEATTCPGSYDREPVRR